MLHGQRQVLQLNAAGMHSHYIAHRRHCKKQHKQQTTNYELSQMAFALCCHIQSKNGAISHSHNPQVCRATGVECWSGI